MRNLFAVLGFACCLSPSVTRGFEINQPCSGGAYGQITGDRRLVPACAGGDVRSLSDLSTSTAQAALSGWRQWHNLDRNKWAIWIDHNQRDSLCSNDSTFDASIPPNLAIATPQGTTAGQASRLYSCGLFSTPTLDNFDIRVSTSNPPKAQTCSRLTLTQQGTWVHELGHAYGLEHEDDVLSSMNSFGADFGSCLMSDPTSRELSIRPDPDSIGGYGAIYGYLGGFDIGLSVAQMGSEPTDFDSAGKTAASANLFFDYDIVANEPFGPRKIEIGASFSLLNMRGGLTDGSVEVRYWLVPAPPASPTGSLDALPSDPGAVYFGSWDSHDVQINSYTTTQVSWSINRNSYGLSSIQQGVDYVLVLEAVSLAGEAETRDNTVMTDVHIAFF